MPSLIVEASLLQKQAQLFPPPRPPDLQPPACGQREELALEGPHAFHFTELPLLRGQKSRSCLQSCCREELGGGGAGEGMALGAACCRAGSLCCSAGRARAVPEL